MTGENDDKLDKMQVPLNELLVDGMPYSEFQKQKLGKTEQPLPPRHPDRSVED